MYAASCEFSLLYNNIFTYTYHAHLYPYIWHAHLFLNQLHWMLAWMLAC